MINHVVQVIMSEDIIFKKKKVKQTVIGDHWSLMKIMRQ